MSSGNVSTMLKVDSALEEFADADLNHEAIDQEGLRCKECSDLALCKSSVVHARLPPFTVRSGFWISLNSAADSRVSKEDTDSAVSTSRKRRI